MKSSRLLPPFAICAVFAWLAASARVEAQGTTRIFQPTSGTHSWNNAGNWNGGIPDNGDFANLNINYSGATTVNLNGSYTLRGLSIGDNNADNGLHVITIANGTGTGNTLIFQHPARSEIIKSNHAVLAVIQAAMHIKNYAEFVIGGNTLRLEGPVTVGPTTFGGLNGGPENFIQKLGGGILQITGNLIVNGPGPDDPDLVAYGYLQSAGTSLIAGASNVFNQGLYVQGGTINFGAGTGASTTTFNGANFSGSLGQLRLEAGTVNFGVNTDPDLSTPTNNVSINMDQIRVLGGTLNLRNGTGVGTTTLNLGTTGTLTLSGGTTTFFTAAGTAGGSLNVAAGAKLMLNYVPFPDPEGPVRPATVLNFTSTNGATVTFASLGGGTVAGALANGLGTVLRAQAGNGILRIGGDGIDDIYHGQLNMAGTGVNARFVKIGSETLTLGGTANNETSRIRVDEGTLVLAKESKTGTGAANYVNAVGSSLEIMNGGVVRLAGSHNSFGSTINLYGAVYNDQIFRNANVVLNGTGTLDLNGFYESFTTILGNGIVTNTKPNSMGIVGLGDNNYNVQDGLGYATGNTARTFEGTLVDGAGGTGKVGLMKSGDQTFTLTNAGNTYTGPTHVARATLQLAESGRLQGTSDVFVSRNSTLMLNNNSGGVNADRINNNAAINLERGTLTLQGDAGGASIIETVGDLKLNSSYNVVRLQHNSTGGTLRFHFNSYERSPGAQVAFVENHATSGGFGAAPQVSLSQITFANLPTNFLIGGAVSGAGEAGGNTRLLVGAFGGPNGNNTNQFVTITTVGGLNYARPLVEGSATDYWLNFAPSNTISTSNLPTGLAGSPTSFDNVAGAFTATYANNTSINVVANAAFNAFNITSILNLIINDDKRLILGGMDANAGLGTVGFDGSGMLRFNSGLSVANNNYSGTNINGGTLFFGHREAIIRANSGAVIRSVISNYPDGGSGPGLSKSGAGLLSLMGENTYAGPTWINEGQLGIFTSKALGLMGSGNEVIADTGAILSLNGGINLGDGTPEGSKDLYLAGASTALNADDRHNVWAGDVLLNATNAAGQTGFSSILRARGNSVLTVLGTLTVVSADPSRPYLYNINPSFADAGQGQNIILENNLNSGVAPFLSGSVINLARIADFNGQAAGGSGVLGAGHEKPTLIVRGYTGQTVALNNDFVVKISDASDLNGRLDLRSGFVFVDTDYGTAGKGSTFTQSALIRLHDGSNVDRSGSIGAFLLTQPGTAFHAAGIQVAENNGGFSSQSVALIGGVNRSGTVVIGNLDAQTGSLRNAALSGASNRAYASTATVNSGATSFTLNNANALLRIGYGITGNGIAPGTTVTAINGTTITLSQPTIASAGSGTSYTFGFLPQSNVLGQSTNPAAVPNQSSDITLASTAGFQVGQGISGPGIPAGTVIIGINGNTLTLSTPTTAAGAINSVYRSYPANQQTITLSTTAGLKVGMGLTGAGIPVGAYVTAVNGNNITISAPVNGAFDGTATFQFPLASTSANSNGTSNSGQNVLSLFSTTGLSVGTIINHANIPLGTIITAINPATNQVTLSNNLTANIGNNTGISVQKNSNFSETRLYAAEGGTVNVNMRVWDGANSFSLINDVAALTKVGRGTVNLRGSRDGGYNMDGGINLFGGTLVFDYQDIVDPDDPGGPVEEEGFTRDFSRISQGSPNAPHQLTLGGGKLLLRDKDTANIVENARGLLTIRPGASEINLLAGADSSLTLNLGYHNPFLPSDPRYNWRAPERYAGGTLHLVHANDENSGGSAIILYSQNAPSEFDFGFSGKLAYNFVIPYATVSFELGNAGPVVDFAAFGQGLQAGTTAFGDASGNFSGLDLFNEAFQNDVSQWHTILDNDWNFRGYFRDDHWSQANGQRFSGTLQSNFGANDFRGVRSLAFFSNAPGDNVINLGGTRLVLGTDHPVDFGPGGGNGAPVFNGGSILISNTVGRLVDGVNITSVVRDQYIRGGSLSSALPSTYFNANTMIFGGYTTEAFPNATSTDLIIHNHNVDGGTFSIESSIVNFQAGLPLNLVVSGPGITRLAPSGTSTYTGVTYVNEGTLWLQSTGALGQSASAMIYLNGGTLEWASVDPAQRASLAIAPGMVTTRPLVLGGNGGIIKTTAEGTVVSFGGAIRAEDNLLSLQLPEHRMTENIGVGDLVKTGAGTFVISNSTPVGATGWSAYYGITEILEGTLQVNISAVNAGILGSHYSHLDGTRVAAGTTLALQITGGSANGTHEWFDFDGGTLRTTPLHLDGSLDGVLRFSADSVFDITQGALRLNPVAGMVEGSGKLTKTGVGSLYFYENNATYTGDIEIKNGAVIGASQGLPFGSGSQILLGDNTPAAFGESALLLQARTADVLTGSGATLGFQSVSYKALYEVAQDIVVRAEGGPAAQTKVIGVLNTGTASVAGGAQNDRYSFLGSISLFDDLIVRYTDDAANTALVNVSSGPNAGLRGGRRTIALSGNLIGAGNIQTEVVQNGGTINGVDPDQIITFELGGDNSAWTGGIRLGNSGAVDGDRQHILRVMAPNATSAANSITLDYNATLQVGGGTVTIGSLMIGDPSGNANTNQVFVENAASSAGTLIINQTADEIWDVVFRNGTTPTGYYDFDTAAPNAVLNLVKTGPRTATMTQVNTYTGFTQIGTSGGAAGGTLRLTTTNAINAGSQVTVFGGTLELSGANLTLGQVLTLGGGAAGSKAAVNISGGNTLVLNNNVVFNAANNPAGAEIRGPGSVQMGAVQRVFTVADSLGAAIDLDVKATLLGTGGLQKTGAGAMALGGANTYGGGTVINQGTLLAMNTVGSATGTGAVSVLGGAALGGIGFIGGDVTLSGGILGNESFLTPGSPTISAGIEVLSLTSGNLSLLDYSIIDIYLGETGWTKLSLNHLANFSANSKIRVNLADGFTPTAGAAFDLLDWVSLAGGINLLTHLDLTPTGLSWNTSMFNTDGSIFIDGAGTAAVITSQPVNAGTDPGVLASFAVQTSGTAPILLQWQKNSSTVFDDGPNPAGWTDIAIAENNTAWAKTLQFVSPVEADQRWYRVIVQNGFNAQPDVSTAVFLDVNDSPTILAFSRAPEGNLNPGASVTFTVEANNAASYEWRLNGIAFLTTNHPDNTYQINSLTEANQGSYTVWVYNGAGGVETDALELLVNDPPAIITHPQNQMGALNSVRTFSVVATADPAPTYQWQFKPKNSMVFSNVAGATTASLQRTVNASAEGTYKVVISNVAGTVTSNEATLTMVAGNVNIVGQPQHQIVPLGSPLVLTCEATGAEPLRYQWRRNGVNISGATKPTFTVASATNARGGVYTCFVSNRNDGNGNATSQLSVEARVAVVNTASRRLVIKQGATASLSISTGGPVRYQWYRAPLDDPDDPEGPEPDEDGGGDDGGGGGPPPIFQPVAGATAATLRLPNVQPATEAGRYFCKVFLVDGDVQQSPLASLDGGITTLLIFNQPPELEPFALPATIVSEPYGADDGSGFVSFQVPFDPDPEKTPASFAAKGLPPGLRIDNQGRIYGRATAHRFPNPYVVTITARNGSGTSVSAPLELLVHPLHVNLVGTFTGPINPHPDLNGDLGGRIDFKTTVKGVVTGKLLMGTSTHSFRSVLNSSLDDMGQPVDQASVLVEVKRKKNQTPLILELLIDAETNRVVAGVITDSAEASLVTQTGGWRHTWVRSKLVPKPAAQIEGYYTFQMDPGMLPDVPRGFGFGSFTVNGATGRASIRGRLADGTAFTSATFAGPAYDHDSDTIADKYELLLFRTIYGAKARGSIIGVLRIDHEDEIDPNDNTLEGTVEWWRPEDPAPRQRNYKAGFGPFDLAVDGGRYVDPKLLNPTVPVVMDLTPGVGIINARSIFTEAEVDAAQPASNVVEWAVNLANKAFNASAAQAQDFRKTTLVITAKTGALKGKFTLVQEVNPITGKKITRNVSYLGLIVNSSDGFRGIGYFMLPQLPAVAGQTPSNTPIMGGRMIFEKHDP